MDRTQEGVSGGAQRCKEYIESSGIVAEQLSFTHVVRTAADSAAALGIPLQNIVKTVVLWANGTIICCILRGADKVDLEKIRKLVGSGNVRIATKEEVLNATGYEVGGVPSIGHGCKTFVDEKVMTLDVVYVGGGSTTTLLKITPAAIVKDTAALVTTLAQ